MRIRLSFHLKILLSGQEAPECMSPTHVREARSNWNHTGPCDQLGRTQGWKELASVITSVFSTTSISTTFINALSDYLDFRWRQERQVFMWIFKTGKTGCRDPHAGQPHSVPWKVIEKFLLEATSSHGKDKKVIGNSPVTEMYQGQMVLNQLACFLQWCKGRKF